MDIDISEFIDEMPKAVVVLIFRETDGKILSVSRKDDPNSFTLPGGRVNEGETEEAAAKRELKEETGLNATNLESIYESIDGDHLSITFEGDIDGSISPEESNSVKWSTPTELAYGPFGSYYQGLFSSIGIKY